MVILEHMGNGIIAHVQLNDGKVVSATHFKLSQIHMAVKVAIRTCYDN